MGKKRIEVEVEVAYRYSMELEVDEADLETLKKSTDLNDLEKYGVRWESAVEECQNKGWFESDFSVSDDQGNVLIPWVDR